MSDFFDVSSALHAARGFELMSAGHCLWLIAGGVVCAVLCAIYRRSGASSRRGLRFGVSGAAVTAALLRAVLLAAAGEYGVGRLPLHLCAMMVYLCFFHAVRGGDFAAQLLYALGMPGAFFALLFPDWRAYPLASFMCTVGFAVHISLVAYPLMLVCGGELAPDIRKAPKILALLLTLAVPIYAFDIYTGTNYMFLNVPPPSSPLEWFAFLGRPGYILGYFPMLGFVWALIYFPFRAKRAERA